MWDEDRNSNVLTKKKWKQFVSKRNSLVPFTIRPGRLTKLDSLKRRIVYKSINQL